MESWRNASQQESLNSDRPTVLWLIYSSVLCTQRCSYSDQRWKESTLISDGLVQVILFSVTLQAHTSYTLPWGSCVSFCLVCPVEVNALCCQYKSTLPVSVETKSLHFLMRFLLWNICSGVLWKSRWLAKFQCTSALQSHFFIYCIILMLTVERNTLNDCC